MNKIISLLLLSMILFSSCINKKEKALITLAEEVNPIEEIAIQVKKPIPFSKETATPWLIDNMLEYKQAYMLSCEIALIRLSLELLGVTTTEDIILSTIPQNTDDPETSFVCDDVKKGRLFPNGKIWWNNYGAHPPVVVAEINKYLKEADREELYEVREFIASDDELKELIKTDPNFLGAVLWVLYRPDRWKKDPPRNERNMVLGEHVTFLFPGLNETGKFIRGDPQDGLLSISSLAGARRSLFSNRVVGLFIKDDK